MADLKAALDAAEAEADKAVARVQATVDGLQKQIDALSAQVNAGTASDEDVARITALQAKLAAIDPTNSATLPTA